MVLWIFCKRVFQLVLDLVDAVGKALEKLPDEKTFLKQMKIVTDKFSARLSALVENIENLPSRNLRCELNSGSK